MPTLKHLLEELRLINVKPDDVRISGKLYDDLVADAESEDDDDED